MASELISAADNLYLLFSNLNFGLTNLLSNAGSKLSTLIAPEKDKKIAELEHTVSVITQERDYFKTHSEIDSLTGLYNRKFLDDSINREMNRCKRGYEKTNDLSSNFSLISLDADGLKGVNDKYGHDAGDRVIKKVADIIRENLRNYNIACRLGGDEYTILLPNTTVDDTTIVAERIRQSVETAFADEDIPITISVGLTTLLKSDFSKTNPIDSVMKRADIALYAAKQNERNCTYSHLGTSQGPQYIQPIHQAQELLMTGTGPNR